jgi:acyl-CoA hydrolase
MSAEKGTPEASATVLSELIQPSQGNPAGTAHGGELLKMMDNCAGVCAEKHVRSLVVTVGIDNVNFYAPVYIGNQATCKANVTYTSSHSLEVAVSIHAEDLFTGVEACCMPAYFIFCAIDEDMRPKEIPALVLNNDNDRREYEAARLRMAARKEKPRACWLTLY